MWIIILYWYWQATVNTISGHLAIAWERVCSSGWAQDCRLTPPSITSRTRTTLSHPVCLIPLTTTATHLLSERLGTGIRNCKENTLTFHLAILNVSCLVPTYSSSGLEKGCVMLQAPGLRWAPEDCSAVKDFICEQTRCYYYNYGSIPVSSSQG